MKDPVMTDAGHEARMLLEAAFQAEIEGATAIVEEPARVPRPKAFAHGLIIGHLLAFFASTDEDRGDYDGMSIFVQRYMEV